MTGVTAKSVSSSAWLMLFSFSPALSLSAVNLSAQCPKTGETKVIKPAEGTGFRFYRFLGDSSFVYFLDGKTFSLNDKGDPGKTFVFIDDFAYESILVEKSDLAKYVKSTDDTNVLRAQAKHQQDCFKTFVSTIATKDFGPSDVRDGRVFYLWKKENSPGDKATAQYLVSTLVPAGVVVLSVIPTKDSISEDEVFLQIKKYTSRFDLVSDKRCATVLAQPTAP